MAKIFFDVKVNSFNMSSFGTEDGAGCQVYVSESVVVPSGSARIDDSTDTFFMIAGNKIVTRRHDENMQLIETELDTTEFGITEVSRYSQVLYAGINICSEILKEKLISRAEEKISDFRRAIEGELEVG